MPRMGEDRLWRPFDSAERYESEKATRLMPDQVAEGGVYTLRIRWPEGASPASSPGEFGREFAVLVQGLDLQDDGYYKFEGGWQARADVELFEMLVSEDGFVVVTEPGQDDLEMGYFVGSVDPWDLALADLTERLAIPA